VMLVACEAQKTQFTGTRLLQFLGGQTHGVKQSVELS
jgi:hypothetical protein